MRHEQTIDRAQGAGLAAFYDRRAAAALAYCSKVCAPESIADAVEAAFARVFEGAAAGVACLGGAAFFGLRRTGPAGAH